MKTITLTDEQATALDQYLLLAEEERKRQLNNLEYWGSLEIDEEPFQSNLQRELNWHRQVNGAIASLQSQIRKRR